MLNTIVVKSIGIVICKHCKKQINNKAKLVGLSFVCPYCGKPCEEVLKKSINKKHTKKLIKKLINT